MGNFVDLTSLYPLYTEIRKKFKLPNTFKCFRYHFCFLQYMFLLCNISLPSSVFSSENNEYFLKYFKSFFLFLPWIFGTHSFIYDGVFWFGFHIIFFIIFFYSLRKLRKGEYLYHIFLSFIRVYQQVFCPISYVPQFFRLAYIIEHIVNEYDKSFVFSLVFCITNIIILSVSCHLSSVFLDSSDFLITGSFDMFDGKYNLLYFFVLAFFNLSIHLIYMFKDKTIIYLIVFLMFILSFVTIIFRVFSFVYVHKYGLFLDTVCIIIAPFMVLIHYWSNLHSLYLFFGEFLFFIIYIIIINISYSYIQEKSLGILDSYLKNNNSSLRSIYVPSLFPNSIVSVLRIVAYHFCEPRFFEQFLEIQQRNGYKASYLIEVGRFLALFPSKRKQILVFLDSIKTKSNHNMFTLHIFREILSGIIKDDHFVDYSTLDRLYTNYHRCFMQFWMYRFEKSWFNSLFSAVSASTYYLEFSKEIKSELSMHPFDSGLYKRYGNFLLSIDGDVMNSNKMFQISNDIANHNFSLPDPLMKPMSMKYPRLLKYINQSSRQNSSTASALTTVTSTDDGAHSIWLTNDSTNTNVSVRQDGNMSTFAIISSLVPSARNVPFWPILGTIMPITIIVSFVVSGIPLEEKTFSFYDNITIVSKEFLKVFNKSSSSIIINEETKSIMNTSIPSIDNDCAVFLSQYPQDLFLVFDEIPIIQNLNIHILPICFQFFRDKLMNSTALCDIVRNLSIGMSAINNEMIFLYNQQNNNIHLMIEELKVHISKEYYGPYLKTVSSYHTISYIIIFVLVLMFQVNLIMSKEDVATLYLSSKERYKNMKNGNAIKGWEMIYNFLPSSKSKDIIDQANIKYLRTRPSSYGPKGLLSDGKYRNNTPPPAKDDASLLRPMPIDIQRLSVSFDGKVSKNPLQKSKDNEPETNVVNSPIVSITEIDELDTVSVDEENHDCIDSKCATIFFGFFMLFAIWIVLLVLSFLVTFPLNLRTSEEMNEINQIIALVKQLNSSLSFIPLISKILNNYTVSDIDELRNHHNSIIGVDSEVKKLYQKEQCFSLVSIVCTSISQEVKNIIDSYSSLTRDNILKRKLPVLISFCLSTLQDIFVQSIKSISRSPRSQAVPFLFLVILTGILLLIGSYEMQTDLMKSYNSLFHYPKDFLNSSSSKKQEQTIVQKVPSDVIVVSSVAENDEIYSISENSMNFFGKPAADFICKQLNTVFPKIEKSPVEMRHYLMPDMKTKKYFRSVSKRTGQIIKTIMIEELQSSTISTDQLIQKLETVIPAYFANMFVRERRSSLELTKTVFIYLRINTTIDHISIDKYFSFLNNQSRNFSSIKLIRSDGPFMLFAIIDDTPPLVALLFARDLIIDTKARFKSTTDFPLSSIYLSDVQNVRLEIKEFVEPHLACSCDRFDEMFFEFVQIPISTVGISPNLYDQVEEIQNKINHQENDIYCVRFEDYVSLLMFNK